MLDTLLRARGNGVTLYSADGSDGGGGTRTSIEMEQKDFSRARRASYDRLNVRQSQREQEDVEKETVSHYFTLERGTRALSWGRRTGVFSVCLCCTASEVALFHA